MSYAHTMDEECHANSEFLDQEHITGLPISNLVPFACFRSVSWPMLRTPSATRENDALGSTKNYGKP